MSRFRPALLILAAAFASLWGCEKMSLVSPTGSTITLTVNKTSVPISGTAEITAAVIESSGTPVQNGTVVTFTSSFGVIEPREARTEGGTARVTFTGTQSGKATIGAFSGGAKTAADLIINVGAFAASLVKLRAEPATIPQSGGTSQIIATVTDENGSTLPNAPVVFTTDAGTLSPGSTSTDANGDARTTLTTTRTAKVTATVGTKTGDVTVSVVNAPTVTVRGPTSATAGLPANFTITPTVPASGAPIQNVTVEWGDGTAQQSLGPITGETTVSHTYNQAGSFTVVGTATDQTGQRGSGSFSVNVQRILPTITIACPASPQTVGAPGAFTVTPATNPAFPIQNVTVDLGDGETRNLGQITGATSFTKSYASEGGFTATATVTDTNGQRGSSSCAVVVSRSQPTVTLTGPDNLAPGASGTFTVGATPTTGTSIRNVRVVDTNDGRELYNGSSGGSFSASFTTLGAHTLRATATDSAGGTGTTTKVVNVP